MEPGSGAGAAQRPEAWSQQGTAGSGRGSPAGPLVPAAAARLTRKRPRGSPQTPAGARPRGPGPSPAGGVCKRVRRTPSPDSPFSPHSPHPRPSSTTPLTGVGAEHLVPSRRVVAPRPPAGRRPSHLHEGEEGRPWCLTSPRLFSANFLTHKADAPVGGEEATKKALF